MAKSSAFSYVIGPSFSPEAGILSRLSLFLLEGGASEFLSFSTGGSLKEVCISALSYLNDRSTTYDLIVVLSSC